jgi:NAD(P)-dependent dehydrogenase (short-subunit alcohol dehydrogenase family)
MIAKDFAQQLFNLQDRVAFVTGAGSGIGQMIAYGLASAGARVVCFDLREDGGLAETVSHIEAIGGEACFYTGDVRQLSDLRAGVALAKAALAASISPSMPPVSPTPIRRWRWRRSSGSG